MTEQLSMLDTMFLELEQIDETAHMHIGAALVFDPLPTGGTPDIAAVREHVGARISELPRFAQQLSSTRTGPFSWLTWEPSDAFDHAGHVGHVTLPRPGGTDELHEWLGDFWSHRLDRHRPLWEMTLLDGLEGGRWALATKTHHCLVDGVGSLDIAHALLDPSPDGRPVAPAPASDVADDHRSGHFWLSPGLALRGARAGIGAALHPRAAFDQVRAAAELVVREEVIGAPSSSINGPMTGTRRYATVAVGFGDVRAIKERLGGTVNDIVLAVCAGGLRHLMLARGEEPTDLRAQIPVNIRADGREHALGNEVTSLFVDLPVAEEDPLVRHARVARRAAHEKQGSQAAGGKAITDLAGMAPPVAGAMIGRSLFGGARAFNLTITNVPGPRERLWALGAPLVDVLPLVPLFAEHTIGIAVLTYADRMVFGIHADRAATPDLAVLTDGIHHSFRELQST